MCLSQVKAGADFAELAESISDCQATRAKGGEVGEILRFILCVFVCVWVWVWVSRLAEPRPKSCVVGENERMFCFHAAVVVEHRDRRAATAKRVRHRRSARG